MKSCNNLFKYSYILFIIIIILYKSCSKYLYIKIYIIYTIHIWPTRVQLICNRAISNGICSSFFQKNMFVFCIKFERFSTERQNKSLIGALIHILQKIILTLLVNVLACTVKCL